jgi:very-short-patch-repair endonuclease
MSTPPTNAGAVWLPIDVKVHPRRFDAAIATLAQGQHGVVSRPQLSALGLSRQEIDYRQRCGRLHLNHRGVFAVGHRVLSREGRWLAAVLAIGQDAALSHQSAAALWGMRQTARARIDVTVSRKVRSRSKIQVHQATLTPDELTTTLNIPVTTPARTLLDLASVAGPQAQERAINEAEVLHLTSPHSLDDLVNRHRGRPGIPAIQRILNAGFIGATVTRNDVEGRFFALLDEAGLPRPEVNAQLEIAGTWIEPDFMWRSVLLIVELDGYETHGTRAAFESDRARDRALQAAGWRVVRVTWRQLQERPAAVVAELRILLDDPAWP